MDPVTVYTGDTAVLPCQLSDVSKQTPFVKWKNEDEDDVIEQSVEGTHEGEGYKGRVEVPMEELRKGNCSLVLKNIRISDAGLYKSYTVVEGKMGSEKWEQIGSIELSVNGK